MSEVKTDIKQDGDSGIIIASSQDVSGILEQNKRAQNDGVNMKSGMRHAGSIPLVIWDEWMREFKKQHKKDYHAADQKTRRAFMALKLNDPDNAAFRTWKGKI